MMDLENYSHLLVLILIFSIIGARKQENRFKLAFGEVEENVLGLQEKTKIALSEFFRFANRTLVEMKHAKGELNIKKKLSPYQIIDGCWARALYSSATQNYSCLIGYRLGQRD